MTFSEIVAKIDRACGTTATSYTLANKATDVNLAFRDLVAIALKNRKIAYDDNNHTANPFITLDWRMDTVIIIWIKTNRATLSFQSTN